MTATINIYEACGFQDITGQRIDKVASTLNSKEEKVDGLLDIFVVVRSSGSKTSKKMFAKKDPKKKTYKDLLNVPQVIDKTRSQVGTNALLASFN
jgi:chemotaxis protein CheZ